MYTAQHKLLFLYYNTHYVVQGRVVGSSHNCIPMTKPRKTKGRNVGLLSIRARVQMNICYGENHFSASEHT
jgi:hypothetical protein